MNRNAKIVLIVSIALRSLLWFWCFVSIRMEFGELTRILPRVQSAMQESAATEYAAIKIAMILAVAFILDKPLSVPWKLFLARRI